MTTIDRQTEELMFRALEHGIYIGDQSKEEDDDFLIEMMEFINERKNYKAFYERDGELSVEDRFYMDSLYTINLDNNILTFTPLAKEGFFDAFLEVFKFIDHIVEQKPELAQR